MSLAAVTGEASSAPREVGLSVRGTCAACAARVEKKLNAIDSVRATVNFATGRATVTAPVSVPVRLLIEAVEQAGYGADVLGRGPVGAGEAGSYGPGETAHAGPGGAGGADANRVAYLRNRLIVALVFLIPLSHLSVLLSLFPSFRFPGWQWVLVVLAAPVVIWAAWPFHQAALRNARHGFLNPLIAGAAMAASSAFVVGNSVRLRRFGAPGARRRWPHRVARPGGPGRGRVPADGTEPAEPQEQVA